MLLAMDHPSAATVIIISQSILTLGFMERADVPALMAQIAMHGCLSFQRIDLFRRMEKIIASKDSYGIPQWICVLLALLLCSGARVAD